MSSHSSGNVAASVRQRIYNLSDKGGKHFQLLCIRYASERLLYRLSVSPYAHQFTLKGALLFSVWSDHSYRATRDIDFLVSGEPDPKAIVTIIESVLKQPVEEDGLDFDIESIRIEEIREMDVYNGFRIRLKAFLGKMEIPVQIDLGFGDVVIPKPGFITYPTLLNFPSPSLKAYPPESMVAEKVQAMISLGMANSRMKDYYDLFIIFKKYPLNTSKLSRAVEATFKRRKTDIPHTIPLGLSDEFALDQNKQNQWTQFINRYEFQDSSDSLPEVISFLRKKFLPIWKDIHNRSK